MQENKISPFQLLVLVIFFTIGTSILIVPSALVAKSMQDAWIATIIGTVVGILVIWLFTTIGLWFPNLTYIQLNEKIFGKWLGKGFSLLFVFMILLYTASILAHSSSFLNTQMLPNTPPAMLNILKTLVLLMAIRLGLDTIGRSAEILIFVFFFLFFFLVISLAPKIDFHNIEPFFQANLKTIIQSSLILVVVSSINAIALLMVFPAFVKEAKKARKSFIIGNIIGGIVIIIVTLLCILILGPYTTARQVYPSYALAKSINVGNFLNRIEVLMAALWIICIYFKMYIYFFASIVGLSQIFNLKDYRPLAYPLGIIVVALSLFIFPNIVYQRKFDSTTGLALSVVVGLFIPLLLSIVYSLRKKQLKKNSDST